MARNTPTIAQVVSRMDATDAKLDALIGVVGDLTAALNGAPATPTVTLNLLPETTPAVRVNKAGRAVDANGRFVAAPKGAATPAPVAATQAKAEPKAKKPAPQWMADRKANSVINRAASPLLRLAGLPADFTNLAIVRDLVKEDNATVDEAVAALVAAATK